jgi:hypothetical protein
VETQCVEYLARSGTLLLQVIGVSTGRKSIVASSVVSICPMRMDSSQHRESRSGGKCVIRDLNRGRWVPFLGDGREWRGKTWENESLNDNLNDQKTGMERGR